MREAFIIVVAVAAVYALRAYDWFVEGFKHRIASRMLWAAALACALAGFIVYGLKVDPHGNGWPSMVVLSMTLFVGVMGVVDMVRKIMVRKIISTPGDGNGNNWRNAGDSYGGSHDYDLSNPYRSICDD
jgi:hypothetical protein